MNQLPPLPKEAFDGDTQEVTLVDKKCLHKNVKHDGNALNCSCGASWTGPDIHILYKLLTSRAT